MSNQYHVEIHRKGSWAGPVIGFMLLALIVVIPLAYCTNRPEKTPYDICMDQYRGSQVYVDNFVKKGDRSLERQCLAQEQAVYAQRQADRDAAKGQ